MSDWFPGAIVDPGLNANYRRGRTTNQCVKEHFTVGRDSRALIRDRGLAPFLFPKVGPPIQFGPANATHSDSCEWGDEGPGLEFERMSWEEPLTDDQIMWGGRVHRWLHDTYGYPLVLHDGWRLPIGDPFRGFVNHGSLVHRACDQHTDGITQDEFARMVGAAPAPSKKDDDMAFAYSIPGNSGAFVIDPAGNIVQRYSQDVNGKWTQIAVALSGPSGATAVKAPAHLGTGVDLIMGGAGNPARYDVFARTKDGTKAIHLWYDGVPGSGWLGELL